MSTIVTRAGKGSPLTHTEVDNNFTNLNTDKYQSGDSASFSSITNSGNLTFTGTGNRITGDFSNATLANRVMFQNSTSNANSIISVIPNGTATTTAFQAFNNSDPTNASQADFRVAGSTDVRLSSTTAGSGTALPLTMYTGGSERLRIDTSGNVGIGTSSPSHMLDVGGGSGSRIIRINGASSGNDNGGALFIGNGGTTVGAFGNYSTIIGGSYNADPLIWAGSSRNLIFVTGGGANERMRIDSDGNLLVGTTTATDNSKLAVSQTGNNTCIAALTTSTGGSSVYRAVTNQSSMTAMAFYTSTSTLAGVISSDGSSTTYGTSSDYRLKENIAPMLGALAKVQALKPVTYNWKANGSFSQGFIAHELQAVVPEAVIGEKDAVYEDGSIKPQQMDTSFLVATLTAAIQEQQAMIETLKAEVALLKSKE